MNRFMLVIICVSFSMILKLNSYFFFPHSYQVDMRARIRGNKGY